MALDVLAQSSNVTCYGQDNGYVWVTVRGGTSPYTISWQNSLSVVVGTSVSVANLPADTYTVTVVDADGTTLTSSTTISQPNPEDVIPEIGMTLCCLHNDFLPKAKQTAGLLGYKYFTSLPEQGIDCEEKQEEVIYLDNAIDTLCAWNPVGSEITIGSTATLLLQAPPLSCGAPPNDMTVAATLTSSEDGVIASFPPTGYLTTDNWALDIINSFSQQVNALASYSFLVLGNVITINDYRCPLNTITLTINITNLTTCTLVPTHDWTAGVNSATYLESDGTPLTTTVDFSCLTNLQAGQIVDSIKNILSNCNVTTENINSF